jgi:hypothetical protein
MVSLLSESDVVEVGLSRIRRTESAAALLIHHCDVV